MSLYIYIVICKEKLKANDFMAYIAAHKVEYHNSWVIVPNFTSLIQCAIVWVLLYK